MQRHTRLMQSAARKGSANRTRQKHSVDTEGVKIPGRYFSAAMLSMPPRYRGGSCTFASKHQLRDAVFSGHDTVYRVNSPMGSAGVFLIKPSYLLQSDQTTGGHWFERLVGRFDGLWGETGRWSTLQRQDRYDKTI